MWYYELWHLTWCIKGPVVTRRIIPGRPQGHRPDLGLSSSWLKYCLAEQDGCMFRSSNALPSRLLEISALTDRPIAHLVRPPNYPWNMQLWATAGAEFNRFALRPRTTKVIYTALIFQHFQRGAKMLSLSGDISISITFGSDSLCIIQDSIEDWEQECPKMSDI